MGPRKIVNLSLHRSATESFHEFMLAHGFRSTHWPGHGFDGLCSPAVKRLDTAAVYECARAIIGANDVFGDVPYCFLYDEFLHHHSDALYLIVMRNVDDWIGSVRRHTGGRRLHNLEKLQYWRYTNVRSDRIEDYSDRTLHGIYSRHLKAVVNATQTGGAAIRIFELDDTSLDQRGLAEEIGAYIGFKVGSTFPTINLTSLRPRDPMVET